MTLIAEHCAPQHGKTALTPADVDVLLSQLNGWQRRDQALCKTFSFANYHETMAFVNACAWVAHRQDHHPDLSVHYNRVDMVFTTHDAGGLTRNDLICAAKIEALFTL